MDFLTFQNKFIEKWNKINEEYVKQGMNKLDNPSIVELMKLFLSHQIINEFQVQEFEKAQLKEED